MNIKIVHSWLMEYLDTKASPEKIGEALSLSSVSVESIEKHGKDFVYDIEVTTNRVDQMSVEGIAREAAAILPQFNINAKYLAHKFTDPKIPTLQSAEITIINDPALVNRILAVVMEVKIGPSPQLISERLNISDIRSINNLIDITNYVMRQIGHPAHVFDFDRLNTNKLIIRRSKKGEKITTLDDKEYTLSGGDIIADDGKGKIVDLLGIMGTKNSVVTNNTKRILFFLDNNNPDLIRKTSMEQGIRSEAAIINEKVPDPDKTMKDAFLKGIELYMQIADGKIISKIIDIYPNKPKDATVKASIEKISRVIGVTVPTTKIIETLESLGFGVKQNGNHINVVIPSWRANDMSIEEDVIEEVARVYGYHNLPSVLPKHPATAYYHQGNSSFFWEQRVKTALKYWGFTESYTYSMVSHLMYEGPLEQAIAIKNPLNEDHKYMRSTLVPSLLQVLNENENKDSVSIFELSNVYIRKDNTLPDERLHLAIITKRPNNSFYEIKGIIETIGHDMGINTLEFRKPSKGGLGADIMLNGKQIGEIEVQDGQTINLEIDFSVLINHATLKKTFTPIAKYPPIIEDLRVEFAKPAPFTKVVNAIKNESPLVKSVSILDEYQNKQTYRITYQSVTKNLTNQDVAPIRERIELLFKKRFDAKVG